MSVCSYCDKKLNKDEDIWCIEDAGEIFCYQDIETIKDIYNSCVGKDLLECGYSEEFILDLFNKDLEDREIDIFYTTAI